jgi:hypothetical protein
VEYSCQKKPVVKHLDPAGSSTYVCAVMLYGPLKMCSYFPIRTSFLAEGFIASNMNFESDPNDDMQRMGRGSSAFEQLNPGLFRSYCIFKIL